MRGYMKLKAVVAGAALTMSIFSLGAQASAAVLYDNGPIIPFAGSLFFSKYSSQVITNSFTLSQAVIITGVDFGVETLVGDSVSAIDWTITAVPPTSYPPAVGATASVTDGPTTIDAAFPGSLSLGIDSFSTGNVDLAAGTYYLTLQNAVVTNNDTAGWLINFGPSTATGCNTSFCPVTDYSEGFQVLGTAVPEPSAWMMMLVGFGALGLASRSLRKARDGAQAIMG